MRKHGHGAVLPYLHGQYLADGEYSVRPMHKLDMGLHDSSGNVDLWEIGTTDTLGGVMFNSWWTITFNTNGYAFKHAGSDIYALAPSGGSTASGTSVVATGYSSTSAAFRWTLERQTNVSDRVLLYDTVTGEHAEGTVRCVAPGETRSLSQLNLEAAFSSAGIIDQSVTWKSDDSSVATVNRLTGAVTGVSDGETIITCSKTIDSTTSTISPTSYTVRVLTLSTRSAQIYYDAKMPYSEIELREFYESATRAIFETYYIDFNLVSVSLSEELNGNNCPNTSESDICSTECGADSTCLKKHHKSAGRLLPLHQTDDLYTYRLVSHALCTYYSSESGHQSVVGVGDVVGNDALTSVMSTENLVKSIQHELTHNLGAKHDACTESQQCLFKGDLGFWCDACTAEILKNR